jgi:ketosteroid isomerase-like protein
MVDEVAIREILSNYAYAHDSRDLGWSGSLFTDDAILYNEMQNCIGNAEVVEAFRKWNAGMLLTFHRFSNPVLKFVPGGSEAWLMAYFNVAAIRLDRTGYTFGRYFSRFTKRSGRWQIVDWRISPDVRTALTLDSSAGWELAEWQLDSEVRVPLLLHNLQGDRRVEVAK